MKTTTKIKDITMEDIVTLTEFLWNSGYMWCEYDKKALSINHQCFEENIAQALLDGNTVYFLDKYAYKYDKHNKTAIWDEDKQVMKYPITMEDLKKGLERCMNEGSEFVKKSMHYLLEDPCQLDLWNCDAILQTIIFGDLIYG